MKYFIHTLLFLLLLNSFSFAEELPPDIKRIKEKGKIIVAIYYEDTPPFFMHDKKGEFYGFDVELAQDIAKKLDVALEHNYEAKTFDDLVSLVAERKADVAISMLSNTLNRAIKVRFTQPYITLHQSLLINRLKIAQLKGKGDNPAETLNRSEVKIGVISGTSYVDFAKRDYPEAEIVPYQNWDEAIQDVLTGDIMAVLYDEIEIKNWHRKNPEGALYLQTAILEDRKDPLAFAVNWEDEHLLSWLNLYLEKIKTEGTYSRLINTYLDTEEWLKRQQ